MSLYSKQSSTVKLSELALQDKENKVRQLRQALLNFDVCCKRYVDDDEKLLGVLRVKSFDVQNAADAIKNTELFRIKYPELFSFSLEDCKKVYENNILSVFKETDVKGRPIIIGKYKNWHPAEISMDVLTNALTLSMEELLNKKEAQINGVMVIIDFKEVGFIQLTKILSTASFYVAKRGNEWVKGAVIIQIKSVFMLNTPLAVVQVWKAFKLIFSKKIRNRVHIYDKIPEEFAVNFRSEHLPKSLNGMLSEEDANDSDFVRVMFEKRTKEMENR